MKLLQFIGLGTCCSLLMLSSCGKDEPNISRSLPVEVLNLITPTDQSALSYASAGQYTLQFDDYNSTLSVQTTDLLYNSEKLKVVASASAYEQTVGQQQNIIYRCHSSDATVVVNGNAEVLKNFNFFMSSPAFYYDQLILSGSLAPKPKASAVVISYEVGDFFRVNTFSADSYYKGVTETRYPSAQGIATFSNSDITYRVVLNTDTRKATVVMYNVKLAETMPVVLAALVLPDLDLEFVHGGYKVSGENIEPQLPSGNILVPNPDFILNNFTLSTLTADLSSISVQYTVKGVFHGSFTGSYFSL